MWNERPFWDSLGLMSPAWVCFWPDRSSWMNLIHQLYSVCQPPLHRPLKPDSRSTPFPLNAPFLPNFLHLWSLMGTVWLTQRFSQRWLSAECHGTEKKAIKPFFAFSFQKIIWLFNKFELVWTFSNMQKHTDVVSDVNDIWSMKSLRVHSEYDAIWRLRYYYYWIYEYIIMTTSC